MADLLSRATRTTPAPAPGAGPDAIESELILILHAPLQAAVSLEDLRLASEEDPTLSRLRTYIREGWPEKVPEELASFHRVKDELTCWNGVCVARGLCTFFPIDLRARVLAMAHEGHLGIVKVKQRCRDLVRWPGIDRDIETMVK